MENGDPLTSTAAAGYPHLSPRRPRRRAPPRAAPAPTSSLQHRQRPAGKTIPIYVGCAWPISRIGASTDLSHVVFNEAAALTPGAPGGETENVYEWTQGSSVLHLVDVPPEGKSFAGTGGGSVGAPGLLKQPRYGDVWHAVSANGSRVFFTGAESSATTGTGLGQLYLRENPEQPPVDSSECSVPGAACTIEVSESQRTVSDPHGTYPTTGSPRVARYWGANAEGSKVFFTSDVELTNDAQTGPEDNAPNLYEYNVETKS